MEFRGLGVREAGLVGGSRFFCWRGRGICVSLQGFLIVDCYGCFYCIVFGYCVLYRFGRGCVFSVDGPFEETGQASEVSLVFFAGESEGVVGADE